MEPFINKNYLTIWINSYKYPLPKYMIRERKLYSAIWHVGFNPKTTHFSMRDFIKISKKLRSNVVDRIEYDISIYHITDY